MRLYMFEHCSLCFRVRMTAALKRLRLQETVVLDDDSGTMTDLVGKRQIPILVKDSGQPMLESMDMVSYLESIGEAVLVGSERVEVAEVADSILSTAPRLTQPRYPLLGLPEFATPAALEHYNVRKRRALGDLAELRASTPRFIDELMPVLEALDGFVESPSAINGTLSRDDVRILPLLRSLAVVKDLQIPKKVRDYFQTMMQRTGYRPLPAI